MVHEPVLRDEMLRALRPLPGGTYVDGTFGGGGYARAILTSTSCRVVGIDRDPEAIGRGRALGQGLGLSGLDLVEGRFGDLDAHVEALGIDAVDGVVLDLGVSSFQIDEAARGFSFKADGPLDMRMERRGRDAADLVNGADAADLAAWLRDYGEEPEAGRVARAIVARRAVRPFTTTGDLAATIAAAKRRHKPGRDPATNTFQALRIVVNDELDELARALEASVRVLKPEGRLVVVAFHSLEDRAVKRFIDANGGRIDQGSRHLPPRRLVPPRLAALGRGVVKPGAAEIARNPRARSARLRAARRLAVSDADEARRAA